MRTRASAVFHSSLCRSESGLDLTPAPSNGEETDVGRFLLLEIQDVSIGNQTEDESDSSLISSSKQDVD